MYATPPTWSCDIHKRNRERKQQQLLLATLLAELRRATTYWFQARRANINAAVSENDDCFHLLVQTCVAILQHGFQFSTLTGDALQRLVDDFEFLRLTEQMQTHSLVQHSLPSKPRTVVEFLRIWVTHCLSSRCLSQCLQSLVADKELLDCYYANELAFLCQSSHATVLFVCLTAIQLDQYSLLSQLDTQLWHSTHKQMLRHRRTNSQPNFSVSPKLHVVPEEEQQQQRRTQPPSLLHFRRTKSLPCLETPAPRPEQYATVSSRRRCQTFGSTALSPRSRWSTVCQSTGASYDELDMLPSTSACSRRSELSTDSCTSTTTSSGSSHSSATTSKQQRIQLINCDNIKIWTDQSATVGATKTPPASTPQQAHNGCQLVKRASPLTNFLTNLFGSPPVYTSWYRSGVGCTTQDAGNADSVLDTFLPVNGKKLQKRRQQTLFEDAGVSMLDYTTAASSCGAATAATAIPQSSTPLDIVGGAGSADYSSTMSSSCSLSCDSVSKTDNQTLTAFLQMSRYTQNNTDLEKENAHFHISEACIAAIEHVKWSRKDKPSASMTQCSALDAATLAQLPYAEQLNGIESHTAEAVGLQLISRFNDQQLPKLSDLKCLVSESDAPQQLLPMPKLDQLSSRTRGSHNWAPPRQQIIFTEHQPASRAQLLTRQNYRCAGCGMHVAKQYAQHFRYCTYLGKYLCTGCHRNMISAIPAKILKSWDFRCYPVSVFAYRLIEQMYTFPLFHIPDLNAKLYEKQKPLAKARRRRIQLRFVKDFIKSCRFATKEQAFFDAVPMHITNDADMWSMSDFVDVNNNSMTRSIEQLIALSEEHVYACVLCTGRAFVCEYCSKGKLDLIYPWQRKVQRCAQCGACAHKKCWLANREGGCLRCCRLNNRQTKQNS